MRINRSASTLFSNARASGLASLLSTLVCSMAFAQQVTPVASWGNLFSSTTNVDNAQPVIAADNLGHVYVAGSGPRTNSYPAAPQYLISIKYDAASGVPLWTNYCNSLLSSGTAGSPPCPAAIRTDSAGNVYIAVASLPPGGGTGYGYALLSLNPSGSQRWVATYTQAGGGMAYPHAMAVDGNGYVYVTGRAWTQAAADSACTTIKYNAATGAGIWTNRYQAHAKGNAIAVDAAGNVFVAGSARINNSYDYLVIKYDSAGNQAWLHNYDGPAGDTGDDEASALVLDASSNVYVTGYMGGNPSDMYGTVKYDSNGNVVWSDVLLNPRIRGHATAISFNQDHLFVSGVATGLCLTIKCGADNAARHWVKTYSTPGDHSPTPSANVVDAFGNVLITGLYIGYSGPTQNAYYTENIIFKGDSQTGALVWSDTKAGWHQQYSYFTTPDDLVHGPGLVLDYDNNIYLGGTTEYHNTSYPYWYEEGGSWKYTQTYPPINDQCSGAIPLANGITYSMSTVNATSSGDPAPACGYNVTNSVWFTFTPATDGVVEAYTCGSDFDTVLQAYIGSCGGLTQIATGCNDDNSAFCGTPRQSYVSFNGTAGTTYYLMAGGYNGAKGNLSITADVVPAIIKSQPLSGTANAGDSFTFAVTAAGPAPLSYQWRQNGVNLAGATSNLLTLANVYPGNAGNYQVVVSNGSGGFVTSVTASLTVLPALELAVDTSGLTWSTGGGAYNFGWFRQTDVSHDGVDSAECGSTSPTSPYSTAWMQTTVDGPGTLTFYWKFTKLLRQTDYLGFFVDGVEAASLASIFSTWYPVTVYLGSGSHTLKWSYVRSGLTHGGGPGYVDQVVYTPGATAAFIGTQPAAQNVMAGWDTSITVGVGGTPPLSYQWRFNDVNILNATNSSLTLTDIQPVQAGNYSVVVANAYGSPVTSSEAALTVTTVPLPEAVDYAGPAWSSSGNAQWFGQVGTMHDGTDAARSGWLTNSQQSTLSTSLMGPGTLSFWWKVSSETNYDFLRFYINGSLKTNICGEVDWQQQSFALPAGKQTVAWTYYKDISLSRGMDAGWVDQVSYDGPPYLSISELSPQQHLVSWPYSVTGCILQTSTNLRPPVAWQTVTNPAVWIEDNWVVTNDMSGPFQFYRLKK